MESVGQGIRSNVQVALPRPVAALDAADGAASGVQQVKWPIHDVLPRSCER